MDGHHTRQHGQDGGNRRGGRTGAPVKVYRRVVSETANDDDEPKPKAPAFTSSLLQSIARDKEKENKGAEPRRGHDATPGASPVKPRGGGVAGGRGGGGRGNAAGGRRSRSPRRDAASGNGNDNGNGRRVTMTTDESATPVTRHRANSNESNASTASKNRWARKPSGDVQDDPPKQPFRSGGLAQSLAKSSQDARSTNGNGNGSSNAGGSRNARGSTRSFNRPGSRDSSVSSSHRDGGAGPRRTENEPSYRRVEMLRDGRSSSFKSRGRSDSIESDASVQSVQSVQSMRSTSSRYDSKSSRYNTRNNDGRRGSDRLSLTSSSDRPPMRRMERSTSDFSSASESFRGRDGGDRGFGSNRRFQDDRPSRRMERTTSDVSETGSQSSSTPFRGSTLAASSLSKTPAPVIVTKPLAKSSQDVRFAGTKSDPPSPQTKFVSSLASSLAPPATAKPEAEKPLSAGSQRQPPQPFKSSLAASSSTSTSVVSEAVTSSEDEERRRLAAERLKERFAARSSSQGTSLSQLASKSSLKEPSAGTELPAKATRSESPTREGLRAGSKSILSRVGDPSPARTVSDKEARTREFFAKLEKEDTKREAARRTENSFKSSLLSSINEPPAVAAKPTLRETLAARGITPFKSSLSASISTHQRSSSTPLINKTVYSLADLRKLMPSSGVKCPPDLRDMKITEVIEVRPPTKPTVKGSSLASGRRVEVSSRRGGSVKRGGISRGGATQGGRGSKGDRPRSGADSRGGGGGRRGGPPPPPLYDGPIEPLTVSENRWVPKKADKSEFEATLSHVKSVLNKLTREKFAKLTDELCKTPMDSMEMLGSIIAAIMNKAIEEPNFADVYADLCKEFHVRTNSTTWSFLRAVQRIGQPCTFAWTAVRKDDTAGFVGPFPSENECIDAASSSEVAEDTTKMTNQDMWKATLYATSHALVAVVEASKNAFYYKRKPLESLTEYEPVLGEFESASAAIQAATKETSFKRLLVRRCQLEFEKFNKTTHESDEGLDQRQKDLNALRLKRLMLGNMRFIGELFKVDLLNQSVVQACLFYLLGLELLKDGNDDHLAGQEVRFPDEEDVEALCKLLATVGKKYDQPKTQPIMRIVILRLVELSDETRLPSRARFLLKDILEMRDHLWEPRRKEMQQKTLDEVRREAKQLQSQGKNAQHDDLKKRRLKSQISSVQLAKQSSNLLVRKDTFTESSSVNSTTETPSSEETAENEPVSSHDAEADDGKIATRIKSIIQEYRSIHDLQEAGTCVRELPRERLVDFADEIVNRALEGKDQERHDVVELLVKLYEGGAVDATSIQLALVNAMEFLEDIKIDIPLVHQYSALLFGRLIAAGCFGLSWMMSTGLAHLVDTGLASRVFAETLPVIEGDSDERTVVRMVADEEVSAASVLPRAMRRDEAAIAKYVEDHDLAVYFGAERPSEEDEEDDEEDELDPDVESKLRSTLDEYLSVRDLDEVMLCVNELGGTALWRHFVRVAISTSVDAKQATRLEVSSLFHRLITERSDDVAAEDMEWAFETVLLDYEDVRVDVPRLATNFAELWTPMFAKPHCLTLTWLHEVVTHLLATGDAADLLNALLTRMEATIGRDELVQWWQKQPKPSEDDWLRAFSGLSSTSTGVHDRLVPWQQVFGTAQP